MIEERKDERRAEIEAAAYKLLAERGFSGMSMLALARAAGASNQTLYKWYGDKVGLVAAMIARNAAEVLEAIDSPKTPKRSLESQLEEVGEKLLAMLVGERSVALNRAAASDPSGEVARLLSEGGRERVMPRVAALVGEVGDTDVFLALLLGDWPLRRLIGALAEPSREMIRARAARAVQDFLRLKRAERVNI